MNTNFADARERAFTLTDLIILVAMLAAFGVLVPLRAANKPASDRAICLNNLREIATATILFAGDNNDFLPNVGWGTTEKCWLHSANPPDLTGSVNLAPQIPYARASQLWPYHGKLEILRCPADRTNNGNYYSRYVQRQIKITSYQMTGNGIDHGATTQKPFKISQFQPNSVFFSEPDETVSFNFNDGANNPSNGTEGVSQRHIDIPVGSIDSSADVMTFSAFQKLRSWQFSNRWYCYPLDPRGRF